MKNKLCKELIKASIQLRNVVSLLKFVRVLFTWDEIKEEWKFDLNEKWASLHESFSKQQYRMWREKIAKTSKNTTRIYQVTSPEISIDRKAVAWKRREKRMLPHHHFLFAQATFFFILSLKPHGTFLCYFCEIKYELLPDIFSAFFREGAYDGRMFWRYSHIFSRSHMLNIFIRQRNFYNYAI
jgi:hypothetical protein